MHVGLAGSPGWQARAETRGLECGWAPGPRAGPRASGVKPGVLFPTLPSLVRPAYPTVIVPSYPKAFSLPASCWGSKTRRFLSSKILVDKWDPSRVPQTGSPKNPQRRSYLGLSRLLKWESPGGVLGVCILHRLFPPPLPGVFFFVLKFENHPIRRTDCTRGPRHRAFSDSLGKIYPKRKTSAAPVPGKLTFQKPPGTPTYRCVSSPSGRARVTWRTFSRGCFTWSRRWQNLHWLHTLCSISIPGVWF